MLSAFGRAFRRMFRSKRGSELIEAAVVLPLLILMAASLIGAGAFAYENFRDRCSAQKELLEEIDESRALYRKIEKNVETSSVITGAFAGKLKRNGSVYARAIDEAAIVRAGKISGIIDDEEDREEL